MSPMPSGVGTCCWVCGAGVCIGVPCPCCCCCPHGRGCWKPKRGVVRTENFKFQCRGRINRFQQNGRRVRTTQHKKYNDHKVTAKQELFKELLIANTYDGFAQITNHLEKRGTVASFQGKTYGLFNHSNIRNECSNEQPHNQV